MNLNHLQDEAVTDTMESFNSADHRIQATVYQLDEAINSIIVSVQVNQSTGEVDFRFASEINFKSV